MLYIIKAAIALALLYSCFFFLLSKETFHRFNRMMLIGIMLTSLVVPLIHFSVDHPTRLNQEVYQLQELVVTAKAPTALQQQKSEVTSTPLTWLSIATYIYLVGVAIMVIITLIQIVSLSRYLTGGLRHTDQQGNTVILQKGEVSPFSIFHFIVMSVKDYENSRQYILTHEQEHIHLGHSYDLLLLEAMKIFQWFNPFIWFLGRDLKAVHEYEADQAVINQGIDAKSYQQLLVIKVVGNRLQPFTNNLNHGSLKKRIIMMYQKPSNRWLMLKAICAIPVVALTLSAFATPNISVEKIVKDLDATEATSTENVVKNVAVEQIVAPDTEQVLPTEEDFEDLQVCDYYTDHEEYPDITDDDPIYEVAAHVPQFEGGAGALMKFLSENIKYPAEALKNGVQGRSMIKFTVEKNGSVSNIHVIVPVDAKPFIGSVSDVQVNAYTDAKQDKKGLSQAEAERLTKLLDDESARVVALTSGKWTPASLEDGTIVRMYFTLPVTFRLQ